MLRDYQQRAIDQLYDWFESHSVGDPCLDLPTGSGKSWIIAALCKDALTNWPSTRVLMLTHIRELIHQNADKLREAWPGAPMGICAASMRRYDTHEPITFASVQTVRNLVQNFSHIDLCIIDECHLMNNDDQGTYRAIINALRGANPQLRVIGLTATPWRLGQGLLTEGDQALFDDILEPVTIEELVHKGYLCRLSSKPTDKKLDTSGVKKRGGEFIEGQLGKALDQEVDNQEAVQEIVNRSGDRKSWLMFCAGVDHSYHIRDELRTHGVASETITGKTPKAERQRIVGDFKAGKITALTNANVLTTGFDHPDTDLIVMLRPTMSPVLYVQMAGRGLRPKSHTDHCLVLDFAGNVEQHGPITAVEPPKRKGQGGGEAPVKLCPECAEILHMSIKQCPECGYVFIPEDKPQKWRLSDGDIMGDETRELHVTDWQWREHISRTSGNQMVKVTYYGSLSDKPITEYLPVANRSRAGSEAVQKVYNMAEQSGAILAGASDMQKLCDAMNASASPSLVTYKMEGKWPRVIDRQWSIEDGRKRA